MVRPLVNSKALFGYMLILLWVFAGCATSSVNSTRPFAENGNKLLTDDNILNRLKPGTTTKVEVISMLGEPVMIINNKEPGETTWSYNYMVIYSANPANGMTVTLSLRFNSNGVLKPKPDGLQIMKSITTNGKSVVTHEQ